MWMMLYPAGAICTSTTGTS